MRGQRSIMKVSAKTLSEFFSRKIDSQNKSIHFAKTPTVKKEIFKTSLEVQIDITLLESI